MRARFAEVRPTSATLANLAVYTALTAPGDTIAVLPDWAGGHLSHHAVGAPGVRGLRVVPLPYDDEALDVDVDALPAFLARERPALVVLDVVHRSGKTLGELIADLKNYPQVIVNVKVREKRPLDSIPSVVSAIRTAEDELKDCGRVVIRYSGTEALARVMIEAESEAAMRRHADAIADAIRTELGV